MIKKILSIVLGSLFLFCGCTFIRAKYVYDYSMTTPKSKDMTFSDDKIEAVFFISEKAVNFTIKNKTTETLKIIWDNASIIEFGKAKRAIHNGVKLVNRNESQPATIIPPSVAIDDSLTPTENISWAANSWVTSDLFPTQVNDYFFPDEEGGKVILNSKGVKFGLFLPIEYQGNTTNYNFEFQIANVKKQ